MNTKNFNVKEVLKEFEVDSEVELEQELLGENWHIYKCSNPKCRKKYDLVTCHYTLDGVSICPYCLKRG